ncbi:type 1 glutamine amidotransferase [Nitrospinae bacterium AH_259_B05_G02_I21]|nr:type 1 glutamine amidotransferase [Nitrospinae bacterium AH_259_B05_G02_I21]MDA2932317.1 type 1 glutamine amidotransferase [Nitrospinae bacterium AH-259-F20]
MHHHLTEKRVAVLAANFYEDTELWVPYYRLMEEGAQVDIVAAKRGTYTSKYGYPVEATVEAKEAQAATYDAVVIPGGYAPDHMRRSPELVDFVRAMHDGGKVVAAICHAGWMLVSAGILQGKTVTSFFAIKDDMVNAGAAWVDKEVVVDGTLITSRTPADLPAFCRELVRALEA